MQQIYLPLKESDIQNLKAGEEVLLSGVIYTCRDQAHKKLTQAIKERKKTPFALRNQVIYYCGPTPASADKIIGSCGPTTASRMDKFTPTLLKAGVKAMIGKGARSKQVCQAIRKYRAVYFLAPAGLGAFLSTKVKAKELLAYPELGPEAIYRLKVKDFPLIVGIDCKGKSVY